MEVHLSHGDANKIRLAILWRQKGPMQSRTPVFILFLARYISSLSQVIDEVMWRRNAVMGMPLASSKVQRRCVQVDFSPYF